METTRTTLSLNRGWRYSETAAPGATEPGFDDSGWQQVCVPHANRTVPWHSFDDRALQFTSVYRRRFQLPDHPPGRVFIDFDGVMTASQTFVNGVEVGKHQGGYVPFSYEITDLIERGADTTLAVVVDATEDAGIPPFGGRVDYLAFGGIYRDVALRIVPDTFIADVFAKPVPRTGGFDLTVSCSINAHTPASEPCRVEVVLTKDSAEVAVASSTCGPTVAGENEAVVTLTDISDIEPWDIDRPVLYNVAVRVLHGAVLLDEHRTKVGFREAQFTPNGFFLNGRRVKLRGLNRHQTFPFVGGAMPERVQRRDADILKHELKCNVVRSSHYPPSPHFLDRCDEIGLLVVAEIPGWGHIGDDVWKARSLRDTEVMVRRDRNHPSVILWGVRINESPDDREFYQRTNEVAHNLDDSRPTGGVRNFVESELLEDVFTINDFRPDQLHPPNHPHYLVTEFVGHMWPTKPYDHVDRVQEHVLRHAWVLDQLYGDDRFAGGIGWCAFDYNTHAYSGSGDRVVYHGVSDLFRIPKPAASIYRSQCDPSDEVVLEPAFPWARGEFHWQVLAFHRSQGSGAFEGIGGPGHAVICSNCDRLRIYFGDEQLAELEPDRANFPNLPYPPFVTDVLAQRWGTRWHDLRIEGYIDGRLMATRMVSGQGVDADLRVSADDTVLRADGRDATRIALGVVDEFGNRRPYSTGAVSLSVDGPGELIGDNPFALVGGVGAVWLRMTERPGTVVVRAKHGVLGERTVEIESVATTGAQI